MILEEQVVSLELAKKLKELGVKQESAFYWEVNLQNKWTLFLVDDFSPRMHPNAAAFTVAELGEVMPAKYYTQKNGDYVNAKNFKWMGKSFESSGDGSFEESEMVSLTMTGSDTEANARAKMLIYLIEQKIVEAK